MLGSSMVVVRHSRPVPCRFSAWFQIFGRLCKALIGTRANSRRCRASRMNICCAMLASRGRTWPGSPAIIAWNGCGHTCCAGTDVIADGTAGPALTLFFAISTLLTQSGRDYRIDCNLAVRLRRDVAYRCSQGVVATQHVLNCCALIEEGCKMRGKRCALWT